MNFGLPLAYMACVWCAYACVCTCVCVYEGVCACVRVSLCTHAVILSCVRERSRVSFRRKVLVDLKRSLQVQGTASCSILTTPRKLLQDTPPLWLCGHKRCSWVQVSRSECSQTSAPTQPGRAFCISLNMAGAQCRNTFKAPRDKGKHGSSRATHVSTPIGH